MTVLINTEPRSIEDIYVLGRELLKQEEYVRKLRLNMFIKLVTYIDIEHPEKTDKHVLSKLFHVCHILAEEDNLRAKYWMALFYGGKFGSSVVGPEFRKAMWYLNNIGGRMPVYDAYVDICDYFGKNKEAINYALKGIVSSDISIKDRLKLARYFIDNKVIPKSKFKFPDGTGKDFVLKFLEFLNTEFVSYNLKPSDLENCIKGFSVMI